MYRVKSMYARWNLQYYSSIDKTYKTVYDNGIKVENSSFCKMKKWNGGEIIVYRNLNSVLYICYMIPLEKIEAERNV